MTQKITFNDPGKKRRFAGNSEEYQAAMAQAGNNQFVNGVNPKYGNSNVMPNEFTGASQFQAGATTQNSVPSNPAYQTGSNELGISQTTDPQTSPEVNADAAARRISAVAGGHQNSNLNNIANVYRA